MADYPNTPVVSKIVLPSGNPYYIKDGDARDAIDALEQQIAGGMGFKIVWTQTDWSSSTAPTSAKLATIPKDVTVHYKSGASTATGTLVASASTFGNFYLTYSNTQLGSQDYYNEYATISESQTYKWEKIGDTRVDLTGVVTDVAVTTPKSTTSVVGPSSTFTITQPTIKLSKDSDTPAASITITEPTGDVTATGDDVTALTGLGTPSTATALTGVKVTTQPTVELTANDSTATGRIKYVEKTGTTKTNIYVTTSHNNNDTVSAITGITPTTGSAASSVSVTPTTKKLATTSVTGVQSTTTTASKAGGTTYATGASAASTTNTDWLKGVSVTNEVLTIGAATMTQDTFTNVTVPVKNSSATTVATGSTTTSGSGANVVTDVDAQVGDTITVLTGLGTPTTDDVVGSSTSYNSQIISGGQGGNLAVVTAVTDTTKYLSASASGTAVGANGTANAVTGYPNTTTDTVLGTGTTFTVDTDNHTISGSASGANTAWNSKDQKTVLTDVTLNVTKGTNDGE